MGEIITEYRETVDSDCALPILTSSKTEGVVLQEEHFGHKQNHDITGYNILPRNFCTYRNRSDSVDFTFNVNNCCEKGIISKFYPVFCGNGNDTFFISLVLNNSAKVIYEIGYTCTGTSQKVLAFSDLRKINITVPSYEEEKAISRYFNTLDDLIAAAERQEDLLKQKKQAYLQLMFPQEGETQPRLRFSGFSGDWEQRQLGEVVSERNERSASGELLSISMSRGVYPTSYSDRKDNSSEDKSNYKHLAVGDIAYNSMRMWQGACGLSSFDGIISPAYTVVIPSAATDGRFLVDLFKTTEMLNTFQRNSQGLTSDTWNLKYPAFSKIKCSIPSLREQRLIGRFFSTLDSLIAAAEKRAASLRALKSAYLQRMFV